MGSEVTSPTISVIMADYNTPARNLRSAVDSVLAQDFQDLELIVVDDASDRLTDSLFGDLDDTRLRIIRHKSNLGFASALNTAIKAADGAYLVRMDTDDWVDPAYVTTLYSAITRTPEYSVISCRAREFRDDGTLGAIAGYAGEKDSRAIIRGDVPVHGASIMRRSDIIAVGGYPNYRRSQDFALWSELILHGKRLKVIEPIRYYYRVNLTDYTKRKLRSRKNEIQARIAYYPKLGASVLEYRYIAKSIIAGLLPSKVLKSFSEKRRKTQ